MHKVIIVHRPNNGTLTQSWCCTSIHLFFNLILHLSNFLSFFLHFSHSCLYCFQLLYKQQSPQYMYPHTEGSNVKVTRVQRVMIRVRTIPVIGYWYRAVLASTAKYRYRVSVSSVSLAILLFGPSLIVRLSDKASTAADRPPLSDGQ